MLRMKSNHVQITAVLFLGGGYTFTALRSWRVDDVKRVLEGVFGIRRDRIRFNVRGWLCPDGCTLWQCGISGRCAIYVSFAGIPPLARPGGPAWQAGRAWRRAQTVDKRPTLDVSALKPPPRLLAPR